MRGCRCGGALILAGRTEEIQLIHRLCAGWERGQSAVVVASGPVGGGKTALLRTVAEHVLARDGLFFLVAATASERTYPLGVIEQLVRAMHAAGMPYPWPPGADGSPAMRLRQDPGELPRQVSDVICAFAATRRIVIG